jgi:hypothetical protein
MRPTFFAICVEKAHGFAATISLIYLLYAIRCISETSEQFRLLHYTAQFWSTHLTSTTLDVKQRLECNLVTKLFLTDITKWLRIYNPDSKWLGWIIGAKFPSPLYYSALLGLEYITRLLLDKGADVNAQDGLYGNALQAASNNGNEAVVRLLLDKGADVNAQGGDYGNALQAASLNGHEAVVRLLLDKGADVNAQDGLYGNALRAASLNGHEAVVRLLLEKGAD